MSHEPQSAKRRTLKLASAQSLVVCALLVLTAVVVSIPVSRAVSREFGELEQLAQQGRAATIAQGIDEFLLDRTRLLQDHASHPTLVQAVIDRAWSS